ncbi:MAG: YdcF family protein [Micavibrio sp.]
MLSKIFWTLAQPLNLIGFLALSGLAAHFFARTRLWGQRLVFTAAILLVLMGIFPAGPLLLTWLERHYPPVQAATIGPVDGIIVLGGSLEANMTAKTGKLTANDDIGRMFCGVELLKASPKAKIIFSGGNGDILNPGAREGDAARQFAALFDLPPGRLSYEEKSRNTYENALYTKEMIAPAQGEEWALVTSAFHMPRSVGVFRRLGWDVRPYPCAHKMTGNYRDVFRRLPSATANFHALNIVAKEMIGLFAYYVTGKSALFFPKAPIPSEA